MKIGLSAQKELEECGIELTALPSLAEMVSKASKRKLFPYKPIVGSLACNVF
jgi:homocitrate synthase NifV